MDFHGGAEARDGRGRIVMLVDNGVDGDSRVQKAAQSAADLGYAVTLLGKSSDDRVHSWRLGAATVRLLPVPAPLARRRHEFRRAWLRWPLAYPPSGIAAHRAQQVKAWQHDLRLRAARLALAGDEGAGGSGARGRQRHLLRVQAGAAQLLRRWVSFRYWQLTRARGGRRLTGPLDRAYTAFWQAVHGDGAWRRLEPGLWDYELAYGTVIDELAPDLIHAHDFRMIGVGAMAAIRARVAGRPAKMIYDAHEFLPGIKPRVDNARWLPAHCGYEREFMPYPDALITVSESLAQLLQEHHGLAERPAVMLNAPLGDPGDPADPVPAGAAAVDLRASCGVAAGTPLLAYSGGITPVRGVNVMVEALPRLPGVHLALVSLPTGREPTGYVKELLARAATLGVADRVHLLPFVPHWQVPSFLSAADAAVSPLLHLPNHEIALSNKFFEYSHARLPVVVSDVRTMAETVRSTGQGEVFRAGDVDDYLRAVRAVLADPARYRAAYDKPGMLETWTWEAQVQVLDQIYRRLLAGHAGAGAAGGRRTAAGATA